MPKIFLIRKRNIKNNEERRKLVASLRLEIKTNGIPRLL